MVSFFINLNPVLQALLAGTFTWIITIMGAAIVFFFREVDDKVMNPTLGFSAGIMLSASIFSLIIPALEMNKNYNYFIVSLGIVLGVLFIYIGEKIYDYIEKKEKLEVNNNRKRSFLLILAIFLHNIPEGLILGLSFGSLAHQNSGVTLLSALMLTLGIGIQDFPEGCAISLPLKKEGYSRNKAFCIGALSAIVEPLGAVLGALLIMHIESLLPYLLSMAAGAMFYVVIRDLIPESQRSNKTLTTIVTIIGFIIMMILDIALG